MEVFLPSPMMFLNCRKSIWEGLIGRLTVSGVTPHGSIRQFHKNNSDYILHLDCDMLFYEEEGFSWIDSAINLMDENKDILCTLPRGGPPTFDGELHQGTTFTKKMSCVMSIFSRISPVDTT